MSIFSKPDVPKPTPAPTPATPATPAVSAEAASIGAGQSSAGTLSPGSLVSTSAAGLTRKPRTQKTTLIGGA